jgi:hypothetical protein
MPPILSLGLGFALPWRITIAALVIAPLGILLGVPFSTGLRFVGSEAPRLVPWAWAVNGFFTVIGSVGAMILGMAFGFTAVLIFATAWISAWSGFSDESKLGRKILVEPVLRARSGRTVWSLHP